MYKSRNILSRNNNQISSPIDKTANDLILELILKINKYSSKLKERAKLYSIFQEFDTYAQKNLKNFIKLSDNRYRSIKSGNTLNNVLKNQKKTYNELSNKILTNNLYNDKNIEIEEEYLCKKTNNKDIKELYQIRRDIIDKTRVISKKELKCKENYLTLFNNKSRNQRIEDIEHIDHIVSQNKKINNNINTNKTVCDSFRKKKFISKSLNMNFNSNFSKNNLKYLDRNINSLDNSLLKNDIKSKTINNNKFYKEKDVLKSKKEFLDNLVKKDNKNINDYIIDYKLFLNKVKNTECENWARIFNSRNNYGRTFSINLDDIKLLSYQDEQEEVKTINKKETHEVDMKTLVKYTKRGNRKFFLNNIKENSKKRQDSFRQRITHKKHIYDKIYKSPKIKTANIKKSKSDNNIFNKEKEKEKGIDNSNKNNISNNMDNMEKTNYTTFSNFRNTLKTVRNEANNIKNIEQNFDIKRTTLSEFFSRRNFPEIKEYEQELSKSRNNFNIFNNNNIDKIVSKTYYNQSKRKSNIKKINAKNSLKISYDNSKKNEKNKKYINPKIFSDLLNTYNDKKKIWQKEDLKKENIKKEKLSHIAKTKKYLDEMSKFKRKPNLFIDPYSKRDELINNRIKLLTRSLSLPIYSQKKFQNRIEEFNNFIEQKEKEIISNNKIMVEVLKKEKEKLDEKDAKIQVRQKIKKNLEKESKIKNKNDDIELNYKFIPTLKATKKKNKNKSYKDYQEFFEIVKKKQQNGEYDINNIKNVIKK